MRGSVGAAQVREHREMLKVQARELEFVMNGRRGDQGVGEFGGVISSVAEEARPSFVGDGQRNVIQNRLGQDGIDCLVTSLAMNLARAGAPVMTRRSE